MSEQKIERTTETANSGKHSEIIQILFVDDETHILEGLKRTLRSMRNEWQMHFVSSGVQALKLMAQQPFDVIVTDMRMPGMNGAQLLTEVLKHYPHVVRIMLSGHADQQVIMQSVGPTHQYLAKPCDINLLKETIGNACALRHLIASPALQRMVTEMELLPSLPVLYNEMMEAAQSPDTPIKAVGEAIAKDVGMTAKMLQLVNSAFFGLPRPITDAVEAVCMLGLDTVRALLLSLHVFIPVDTIAIPILDAEFLWQHSLRVGKLAKQIAFAEGATRSFCGDAYTAGLLHDCGKVALATHLPGLYAQAMQLARDEQIPPFEAEQAICGASHAEIGAYLMGLWGLPPTIVEALAFHHRPSLCRTTGFSPLTAVYVADWLETAAEPREVYGTARQPDCDYLSGMGLWERIPFWQELALASPCGSGKTE